MSRSWLRAIAAAVGLISVLACSNKSSSTRKKPAGTPTDPVEICERVADVCRVSGPKLGVCVEPPPGPPPPACADRSPCYLCAPQH